VRSLVWPLFAALLVVLAAASTLFSMEPAGASPVGSAGVQRLHEVLRTRAHVAHGHHAASVDDDDNDVDDDGDDYDISSSDEDVEHSVGVTVGALLPEVHPAPEAADAVSLGPARAHASIPEHPPRVASS
jgi:hypothetical protein